MPTLTSVTGAVAVAAATAVLAVLLYSNCSMTLGRPVRLALTAPVTMSFREAFESTTTDKFSTHGYHRFYDTFLQDLKGESVQMLEIGVLDGKSLRAWRKVFQPDSTFYGMAYGVGSADFSNDAEHVHIVKGDQSNCTDLASIKQALKGGIRGGYLDFIIDDGSHVPEHMLKTLVEFFELVRPGGLYFIEDVECNYWDRPGSSVYGYPLPGVGMGRGGSLMESLKLLVEVLNQRYASRPGAYDPNFYLISPKLDPYVSFISFAQNMVVLRKRDEEDAKFHVEKTKITSASGASMLEFINSPHVQAVLQHAHKWLCK